MSKLKWLLSRLQKALWIRVSLFAVAGVLVAVLASLSGRFFPGKLPIDISSEAIDSLLSIVASSMLAVTTFSVGALTSAYGGATSNGTARASQLLTKDKVVQNSLATFVGSFLFSIVGLIALKVSAYGAEGRAVLFVMTIGIIFMIVLALLRWIDQLTKLGRVSDTIDRIEQETRRAMEARLQLPFLGGGTLPVDGAHVEGGTELLARTVGYVDFIDTARLSEIADEHDLRIDIQVLPGAFVYSGTVLAVVHGGDWVSDDLEDDMQTAFSVGALRSFDQDPRFGLVVLSEVALRALSPAVNDPGTAIDIIGRQTRLLTFWAETWDNACAQQPLYPRLRAPSLQYGDAFEDAFNLIGRDGAGQIDVMLRLAKALIALGGTGPDKSRQAATAQLQVALDRARQAMTSDDDLRRLEKAVLGFDG